MKIQSPIQASHLRLQGGLQGGRFPLLVGQRLTAMVLGPEGVAGRLRLELNGRVVSAVTALRPAPGTVLQLEVVRLQPRPELRLVGPEAEETATTQALLRQVLPRQRPLTAALAGLGRLLVSADLSPALRPLVEVVLRQIQGDGPPTRTSDLRRRVQSSGLFLESHLLQRGEVPKGDLKAALLRLLREAGEGSGATALKDEVEAALARITLDQLASRQEPGQPPVWRLDLPLRGEGAADILRLKIRRDDQGRKDTGDAPGWEMTLDFDIAPLGPFRARLHLLEEQVRVDFLVQNSTTWRLVEEYLPRLQEALEGAGFRVAALRSHLGLVEPEPLWPSSTSLLDIEA